MFQVKSWDELTKIELYEILKLRQEVFVVEQCCPFVDNDDMDQVSIHIFQTEDEGRILAYGRIVPPGTEFKELSIGRLVTHPEERGKGLGRALVKRTLEEAHAAYGRQAIRITAQWYLRKFYGSFGFETDGEEFMLDHIPHQEMVRK